MALAIIVLVIGFTTDILPPPLPARHREGPPTPAAGPAATPQGIQSQAGRPFTFGDAEYTVEKTGRASEFRDKTSAFTASGAFLLVYLSVANQGREPLTFAPADFALFDREGRRFSALREPTRMASAENEKKDIFGDALQPGLSMEALLVFDVPKGAEGLTLRLFHGYLDVRLGR